MVDSGSYSFTTAGAFTTGLAAATLAPFMQQDEPPPAMLALASIEQEDLGLVEATAFLAGWPSCAKAEALAKANRARASRDFFMGLG